MRLLLLAGVALPLAAQAPTLAWLGDAPPSGGIGWLVVDPHGPADTVTGAFDGAQLVFTRHGATWVALAPVRIETRDTANASVRIQRGTERLLAAARLPVAGRTFRSSRLTVDPRFTDPLPPDIAARVDDERERSAALTPLALSTPPLFAGPFRVPRPGRITSEFGTARTFNGQVRSRHYGTDYDGTVGAPVRVANRGVVALVGDFYYSGRIIYVNHGGGLITAYLHLSEALVAEGDTVEAGQVIGRVGSSGRVTGPHLHWAVRHGARLVDGTALLALPGPTEIPAAR